MSHDIVTITTVARRIAREHNQSLAPADFARDQPALLIFDAEGRLRERATQDTHAYGTDALVYRSRAYMVSGREVQAWLDARQ